MPVATKSLTELVTDYLRDCRLRALAETTLQTYRYALEGVLLPFCTDRGLELPDQIDQRLLEDLTELLMTRPALYRGKGLSRSTIRTYLGSIGYFVTWASKRSAASGAPPIPSKQRAVRQILTREELVKMEDAARFERDKLIVLLMGDRGLRLMELVRLRTTDLVELQRGKWFLRVRGKGAGGAGLDRWVPVPRLRLRLERLLRARPSKAAGDALFLALRASRDGYYHGLTGSGVEQVIKITAKAASIERRVFPHLLRHSAITHYGSKGMNRWQLQTIFGNHAATDLYMHLTPLDAYEWEARLGD